MHVAHNFISLSFDSSDANAVTTVLTGDAAIDGESFNFAAMLESNVSDEAPGGELLPQPGSELPQWLNVGELEGGSPEFEPVLDAETQTNAGGASAEIVASLDIKSPPATLAVATGPIATSQMPGNEAGTTRPFFAEPRATRTGELGVNVPGQNAADSQLSRDIHRTVSEVLAQGSPELSAAVRRIDVQTLNINSRTQKAAPITGQLNAAASGAGIADVAQQLTDLSAHRMQVQPLVSTVAGNEMSLELGARKLNSNATQPGSPSISLTAPLPTSGDRPVSPFLDVTTSSINTPVRDAVWGDRISQQVLTMASNKTRTAEIRLTPAELGPLRIQVDLDDGKTHVAFQSQHAVTREAIETALPRLREMLAENGLSLGQANVGDRDRADREHGHTEGGNADVAFDGNGESDADGDQAAPRERRISQGLLDAFV